MTRFITLSRAVVNSAPKDAVILVEETMEEGNLAFVVERQPDGGIIHSQATGEHRCFPVGMAREPGDFLEGGDWTVIPYVKSDSQGSALCGAADYKSYQIRWID